MGSEGVLGLWNRWLPRATTLGAYGLHGLGALLFPSVCVVCREPLDLPLSGPLCARCLRSLPRVEPPFCPRCGLPYEAGVEPGRCGPCRSQRRRFRRARAYSPFDEDVRRCLHALKYDGRRRLARILGREASRRWIVSGDLAGVEAVVPVPMSRKRRRERGFNQAELLARAIAGEARIALASRVLRKTLHRPPQTGLSAAARRRNAARAYRAKLPPSLRGKVLLLVDDVFTTGATVDAAAGALLQGGAAAVDVLTIARVP